MRFSVLLLLILATFVATGCERLEPLVVKNGCKGSWLAIVDGDGRVLANHLNVGEVAMVVVEGYRDSTIHLIASGYEVGTNRDLGTARTSRFIPRYNSSMGPDQLEPWVVDYLSYSSADGGCRR